MDFLSDVNSTVLKAIIRSISKEDRAKCGRLVANDTNRFKVNKLMCYAAAKVDNGEE